MARYKTIDRKNVENVVYSRFALKSGQMHGIHGMANFEVQTQESQNFGFYSNTGQGATEGGLELVKQFYIRQACQLKFLAVD